MLIFKKFCKRINIWFLTINNWIWGILLQSNWNFTFHESEKFTSACFECIFKNRLINKLLKFCRNFISPLIWGWKFNRQILVLIFQFLLIKKFDQIIWLFIIRYNFYTLPWNSFFKSLISRKNLKSPIRFTKWRLNSINLSLFFSI